MRFAVVVGLLAAAPWLMAQERAVGEVTSISAASNLMTLRTDAEAQATITLQESTSYMRVAPGARDLRNAEKITLADIDVGDRVLARGKPGSAGTIIAASVLVMSKADVAKKHEAEQQEWREKGIVGVVASMNAGAREITLNVGNVPVTLVASQTSFKRYAEDSPRYTDATLSSFDAVRVGDQVRALGERQGDRFVAREVVSGSFRNLAGAITAVDTANNTVTVKDLGQPQAWIVTVTSDSLVRRLAPEAATMLAQRIQGTTASPGARRPDLHQVLERMPPVALNELKPGDAVIIASTNAAGPGPGRVTAIALLVGVEPLLAAAPRGADPFTGRWDFSGDLAMGAPQ